MLVKKYHPQKVEVGPIYYRTSRTFIFFLFFIRKYATCAPRYCAFARLSPGCRQNAEVEPWTSTTLDQVSTRNQQNNYYHVVDVLVAKYQPPKQWNLSLYSARPPFFLWLVPSTPRVHRVIVHSQECRPDAARMLRSNRGPKKKIKNIIIGMHLTWECPFSRVFFIGQKIRLDQVSTR